MRKRKILFVNCMMESGGVERSLCDVLAHIDYSQYDVSLYLDSNTGALINQVPNCVSFITPNMDGLEGPFARVIKKQFQLHNYQKIFLRIIKKLSVLWGNDALYLCKALYYKYGKFDVVVAYREGAVTQFAYRAFQYQKFVSWWHYGEVQINGDQNLSYSHLKNIDQIAGVSAGICNALCELYPNFNNKIYLIPNMLDVALVQKKSEIFQPYVRGKHIRIVSVGRLSPEKHFENILAAAKCLKEAGKEFCWHLVGDGPEREKLCEAIADADLSQEVVLEGNQPNPYPYVKNADLFVHPSYVESQGLTILEAMALGVPCVVTKSTGPCEFIEDGVNAILTEQSPESLTEKVMEIMDNAELYRRIKENTACPEEFLPANVMKKINALLE